LEQGLIFLPGIYVLGCFGFGDVDWLDLGSMSLKHCSASLISGDGEQFGEKRAGKQDRVAALARVIRRNDGLGAVAPGLHEALQDGRVDQWLIAKQDDGGVRLGSQRGDACAQGGALSLGVVGVGYHAHWLIAEKVTNGLSAIANDDQRVIASGGDGVGNGMEQERFAQQGQEQFVLAHSAGLPSGKDDGCNHGFTSIS
jgi:hypothetical protein